MKNFQIPDGLQNDTIILQNKTLYPVLGNQRLAFPIQVFCLEGMKSDLSVRQPRYIGRTFGR